MNFYSQSGQDKGALSVTRHKSEPKFFVDIGAYDGINTSNTLALEECGWTGICVEANPEIFATLANNRPNAINLQFAVASFDGHLNFSGYFHHSFCHYWTGGYCYPQLCANFLWFYIKI